MTAPLKPWETSLQNSGQVLKNVNIPQGTRSIPVLPPRPQSMSYNSGYSSYSPYSSIGSSYGGYGGYSGYGGLGAMPYRSSMYGGYNSYGGYGSGYGMYGMGGYGNQPYNDAESRFVQFAEERSRNTFANVESVVRAFNSMAMMLDNTFFAMTSSFRAILGVAENFGRLRSTFGHIWHALNIFRLVKWMYRKLLELVGVKVASVRSQAWKEALTGSTAEAAGSGGSSWSAIAFLGMILSAPYFISKFLPKYEDALNPEAWKSLAIPAEAVFPFSSQSPNELSFQENDTILLAPKSIQDEMKLMNSGWAYATCNGRTGVVPLTYLKVTKKKTERASTESQEKPKRRVSFGKNQVFEMTPDEPSSDVYQTDKPKRVFSKKSRKEVEADIEKEVDEEVLNLKKQGVIELNSDNEVAQKSQSEEITKLVEGVFEKSELNNKEEIVPSCKPEEVPEVKVEIDSSSSNLCEEVPAVG